VLLLEDQVRVSEPRSRTPGRGVLALVSVVALVGAFVGTVVEAGATKAGAAPASSSCSFANAGSGPYARTLCWFDMSSYNPTSAAGATGQSMSVSLPGGYSISFTLKVSGGPIKATAFPTYAGAYLGNGAYTGVIGKPALYQTQSGTTTTAALSGISVVDASGKPVTGYSFVGADAESTDTGESITWTSDQSLSLISKVGNACNSGALLTGVNTTTVKCSATFSSTKTGTAILAAEHPAVFSQTMVGAGLQAVAFGVLVSTVQLNKTVVGRINPGDAFTVNVSSASGSSLGSASTGTSNTASTGQITVLSGAAGETYTLSEAATSGVLSDYGESWSCTRNGTADPSLPSGSAGASVPVTLGVGDFVNCTIINTPLATGLSLVKHAGNPVDVNHDGITDAGDTIAYTFTVTNTGVLPLSNISVSDPKAGPVICPQSSLAPGASETCAAANPYIVTSDDVAAGTVANTATALGLAPGAVLPIQSAPSSTATPTETPAPAVSMVKIADASDGDTDPVVAGESITYSYLVTNAGNDNLSAVSVSDPTLGPVTCPVPAEPGLAPGASETCTADNAYTVTQTDVDGGQVTDTATAQGTDPDGNTSDPTASGASSTVTVPTVAPAPTVSINKQATVSPAAHQGAARPGDIIGYSYVVTNTGNVTLASVAVDDPTLGPVICPAPAGPGLVPGASETCYGVESHTVTQADVDAGKVTDTATATGTDNSGLTSPVSSPSTVSTLTEPAVPAISLVKMADASTGDDTRLTDGEAISYSYLVTNTGDVTLASVAVDDPTLGPVTCPVPTTPGLAPGASETCTGDALHTVTQADVDAGQVTDTATASAFTTSVIGSSVSSAPSTVVVPGRPDPSVAIDKRATVSPAADQVDAKLGDTIAYSYVVTHTGDVDLASLAVDDPTLGPVLCPVPAAPGLAPGGSETCTGEETHTVTEADAAAGQIVDTATATGTDTQGIVSPSSAPSTATVPVESTGTVAPDPTPPTPLPPSPVAPSPVLPTPVPSPPTSAPGSTPPVPPAAPSGSGPGKSHPAPGPADPAQTTTGTAAVGSDPGTARSDPPTPAAFMPEGLGSIDTDLGRWLPRHHHIGGLETGLGLLLLGGGAAIVRVRRRIRGRG
jgi:hypothetical protein